MNYEVGRASRPGVRSGASGFKRLTALSQLLLIITLLACMLGTGAAARGAAEPREVIAKAIVTEDAEEQSKLVSGLAGSDNVVIRDLLIAWKEGGIYIFEAPAGLAGFSEGEKVAVTLSGAKDAEDKQAAVRLSNAEPLTDGDGKAVRLVAADLTAAETDTNLRKAMGGVLNTFALVAADPNARLNVITQIGLDQDPLLLPALEARASAEPNPGVRRAIRQSIAQIQIKSEDPQVQIHACGELAALGSISSQDALKALMTETSTKEVSAAAKSALKAISTHVRWVDFYSTIFQGFSTGSVLLVVAIGLAITFGLMGVINMAHGELIAVGAYTTYVVQNIFGAGLQLTPFGLFHIALPGLNASGARLDAYFLVALPLSFLTAAAVGIALERGMIRFLYRRPLESLLATWGMSMVLQQLFKFIFGSNNVQVYSPQWLSGNWTVFDVILGWKRMFVIGFAILIILGCWAILNKTPLGLLIRAVMQNRAMAACMGVRTERVNMLTFGLGSGLAGLAGALISQIDNVGPSLGQNYIVSAFMTVVVGGVGSLAGTVISALGIGVTDQSLQHILLNPVLGKILVLFGIILFLQWRPSGIFVTKSRSLEG